MTVHAPTDHHPNETVSTCSVTLIDSDLVVLAAHCISNHPFEVPTSSVTFDYEVQCDGSLVPAYNAVFYKVIKLVKYRYTDGRDYAILQLRGTPPVPSVPIRISDLASNENALRRPPSQRRGEESFAVGHGLQPIISFGSMINVDLDVAGGSSGSSLFDSSGNVVGVLSYGWACNLYYSAMKTMMSDPIIVPNPPTERAVMMVIDRSGSMSESAGGGKIKINEARAAAELFVSMLRTTGNRAGLVSFSNDASNPVDFGARQCNQRLQDADEQQARSALAQRRDQHRRRPRCRARSARGRGDASAVHPASDRRHGEHAAGDRRRHRARRDRDHCHRLRCREQSRWGEALPTRTVPWRPLQACGRRARAEEVFRVRIRRDLRGWRPRRSAAALPADATKGPTFRSTSAERRPSPS